MMYKNVRAVDYRRTLESNKYSLYIKLDSGSDVVVNMDDLTVSYMRVA